MVVSRRWIGRRGGELRRAARLAVAGTAIGIVTALMLGRLVRSLIYNVSPWDPLTFVVVTFAVLGVAIFACYLPALRATRADPMTALRAE